MLRYMHLKSFLLNSHGLERKCFYSEVKEEEGEKEIKEEEEEEEG